MFWASLNVFTHQAEVVGGVLGQTLEEGMRRYRRGPEQAFSGRAP